MDNYEGGILCGNNYTKQINSHRRVRHAKST